MASPILCCHFWSLSRIWFFATLFLVKFEKLPNFHDLGYMGSRRVWQDWATSLSLFTFMHWRRKWQPTPLFLLQNPRDGGAWWAAVYGVAQSRTWLKRLSSSRENKLMQNYSLWWGEGVNKQADRYRLNRGDLLCRGWLREAWDLHFWRQKKLGNGLKP